MRSKMVLAAAVAPLFVSGCFGGCAEKVTELAVEKATGVEVDEKGGKLTIKGADGEVVELNTDGENGGLTFKGKDGEVKVGGGAKLPDGFPLATFEGSAVQASAAMANDDEQTWMATLTFQGELAAAVSFYEAELKGKGFEVEKHEIELDGNKMVNLGGKAEGREASVSLSKGEEGIFTQISYRQDK